MTRTCHQAFGPLAGLALLALAGTARAHPELPRVSEIIVEPGNPTNVVLHSDVWGLFHTTDGGKTWQWICAEAYGSDSLTMNRPNMSMAPGGRFLVADGFLGLHVTDDFCTWKEVGIFRGEFLGGLTQTSGGLFVLAWTSGDGGVAGLLWQSTDRGDNFAPVGNPLPSTFGGTGLAFAPSAPGRAYVAGRALNQPGGMVERSDDGGGTWAGFRIPVQNDSATLRIAAVHATRPDVLFIRADLEDFAADVGDQIWGTADGGENWRLVYEGIGDLPGFAISPDGTEVMIAGPKEGIQLASLDAALTRGQVAFTRRFDGEVWGLYWTNAALTAGTDDFTPMGVPAFTYGNSNDEGKSFSELMSICDVRYDACDATSSLRVACDTVYDGPSGGFRPAFQQGSRCVGSPDSETGSPSKGRTEVRVSGGCEVGAARLPRGGSWFILAALGPLVRRLRGRSRRAR